MPGSLTLVSLPARPLLPNYKMVFLGLTVPFISRTVLSPSIPLFPPQTVGLLSALTPATPGVTGLFFPGGLIGMSPFLALFLCVVAQPKSTCHLSSSWQYVWSESSFSVPVFK